MKTSQTLGLAYPGEVIRSVANAAGIRHVASNILDEIAVQSNPDFRLLNNVVEQLSKAVRPSMVKQSINEAFTEAMIDLHQDYLNLVAKTSVEGIPPNSVRRVVSSHFFGSKLARFLLKASNGTQSNLAPAMLSIDSSAIDACCDWLALIFGDEWKTFKSTLSKEQRDRLKLWRSSEELPNVESIWALFFCSPQEKNESKAVFYEAARSVLWLARIIDWFKRSPIGQEVLRGARSFLYPNSNPIIASRAIHVLRRVNQLRFVSVLPAIAEIQRDLRLTTHKSEESKERLYNCLVYARRRHGEIDSQDTSLNWILWHEARWHVLSGDLTKALALYKQAFEASLYRAGPNLRPVIKEALVVASSVENPAIVFIKQLRNAQLMFQFEDESVPKDAQSGKNRTSDFLEEWEFQALRGQFLQVFPSRGHFPGTTYEHSPAAIGPLLDFDGNKNHDYRAKTVKIGQTWTKKLPRLIAAIQEADTNAVEKLIRKDGVDVISNADETPIMMALQEVNQNPSCEARDKVFWAIANAPHKIETVNTRSQKLRLLPLILAVKTGRLDIVQKVLSLGADANRRGETDLQTPLNVCVKQIGMVNDYDNFVANQLQHPLNSEAINSIKRHTNGLLGMDERDIRLNLLKSKSQKPRLYKSFERAFLEEHRRHFEGQSSDELKDIASALLKSNADPNAEHRSPLPGYTPLMLAVELDIVVLAEEMLRHGGDPWKTYPNPYDGTLVDCWQIASFFNSKCVGGLLSRYHR